MVVSICTWEVKKCHSELRILYNKVYGKVQCMIIVRGGVLDHNHEYTHINTLWSVHEAWSHVLNPPMKWPNKRERFCMWEWLRYRWESALHLANGYASQANGDGDIPLSVPSNHFLNTSSYLMYCTHKKNRYTSFSFHFLQSLSLPLPHLLN